MTHSIKSACKNARLPSVQSLTDITGVPHSTLRDWLRNKPNLFEALIVGAAHIHARQSMSEADQLSD